MQSVHEIKMNQPKSLQTSDINLDNFNPIKTFYGTNTVTPFLTVEIEGTKTNHELNKLVTRIGRSDGNDIKIDNLTISNTHASILIEGGQFFIQDNASTNGTFVNDIKISKILIKNGDTIRLGKSRLIFTC
jgi:pSer/pThr/pTyr-binding forkhead associated (FHA) protein